jgi:hypothetical protein
MTRFLTRFFAAVALVASASVPAAPGPGPWVGGERALAPKSVAVPKLRLGAQPGAARARIELTAPDAADLAAIRARNAAQGEQKKRVALGIIRPVDAAARTRGSDVAWTAVEGGYATQVSVTSAGAAAVRVSVALAGVPADVQMVFFGSADATRLVGPVRVGDIADRTKAWWSPITEGETQTVEFFAPAASAAEARAFVVTGASHLFAGPSSRFTKLVSDIGTSGACNVDIACSPLTTSLPFDDAVDAVALMSMVDGNFLYQCTGTLLNDSDPSTQVPWFFSANHCMDNENPPYKTPTQMQAVANTVTTFWYFQANACKSGTPLSNWTQVGGGAQLLYSNPQNDALFLRLNASPPGGSYFLGWDATTASSNTGITVIHHPEGDLKKVSIGSLLGLSNQGTGGGNIPFYEVKYSSGTTEPGSSGSGLLTFDGSQYLLRGGLWAGEASCDDITGSDFYSRFDLIYPSISQYIGSSGSAVDYTDLWWGGNSESGWGLNLIQHASRNIFGTWYTYDAQGHRTWYVIPGGNWTSATVFTGNIYRASGPPANAATFDPTSVKVTAVGAVTITFTDANNGTFAFNIEGTTGVKSITRQSF